MSGETPWRRLWSEIDAALYGHGERLAKNEARFLKEVRLAVKRYGQEVNPSGFDEYGQPLDEDPLEEEEELPLIPRKDIKPED